MSSASWILSYISAASCLVPLAVIFLLRPAAIAGLRFLFYYLLLEVVTESVLIYYSVNLKNSMFLGYIYAPLEMFLLMKALQVSLRKPVSNNIVYAVCAGFTLFCIADWFLLESPERFNSFSRGVECVVMVVAALYYSVDLMLYNTELLIQRIPAFWISVAVMLYFSGNLILFLLMNYNLYHPGALPNTVWLLHSVLNTIFNLILVNGILCLRRTTK